MLGRVRVYARGHSTSQLYNMRWQRTPDWVERFDGEFEHRDFHGPRIVPCDGQTMLLDRADDRPRRERIARIVRLAGLHSLVASTTMPTGVRVPLRALMPDPSLERRWSRPAHPEYERDVDLYGMQGHLRVVRSTHEHTNYEAECMLGSLHVNTHGKARQMYYPGDARHLIHLDPPKLADVLARAVDTTVAFAFEMLPLGYELGVGRRVQPYMPIARAHVEDGDYYFDIRVPTADGHLEVTTLPGGIVREWREV